MRNEETMCEGLLSVVIPVYNIRDYVERCAAACRMTCAGSIWTARRGSIAGPCRATARSGCGCCSLPARPAAGPRQRCLPSRRSCSGG